ncbi:MAG: DUF1351 domain-containing protein [Bacillota bacterium]|nr:DUF1351 domain-containing protein [Bacillota bacterium]
MLELELNKQLPIISMNYEDLKASVSETMEKFKHIVVTEDNLRDSKDTLRTLSKMRNEIDRHRKDVKQELLAPITSFEMKCKVLMDLIKEAEDPIKSGIKVFDDKKKEEKRQVALKLISEVVESLGLEEKYAKRLNCLDNYMNLTAKPSAVKKDIEQRAFLLLQEQTKEQELLEIIKDAIENANETINTTLKLDDFGNLISMNIPTSKIIQEINKRAELIREAEKPKEVITTTIENSKKDVLEPQEPINDSGKIFYVEMHVKGNKEAIAKLGQFLKDNNYQYEKLRTGVVDYE